ncbi:MAG: hypothetical protein F6J98_49150 [Moorea sp. SIO4G2]|nr:hypothetical protein [Moorena sp. SIO4G2]
MRFSERDPTGLNVGHTTRLTKGHAKSERIPKFPSFPCSRFPIPDSRFPIPDSRFPIPDSRFPIPDSRFPIPDS